MLCWGANDHGQTGQGAEALSLEPFGVPGLETVTQVATGDDHSCALSESGRVSCWGRGDAGQLGDGASASARAAARTALPADRPALELVAGRAHACARLPGGRVHCWGAGQARPVEVADLADAVSLCRWRRAHLRRHRRPAARLLGRRRGRPDRPPGRPRRDAPCTSCPRRPIAAVSAGGAHTCALDTSGSLNCFGLDAAGQLGSGRALHSAWPRPVAVPCP